MTRSAARAVIAWGRGLPRRDRAAGRRQPCRCDHVTTLEDGRLVTDLRRLRRAGAARRAGGGIARLLRHHGLHVEIAVRPRASDRPRPTRPGSPTSAWRARSPRSWIARTASPRSMPRTRSRVYRNWLGLMKGDAERRASTRAAGRSSGGWSPTATYRGARRRHADAQGPGADVRPQCRPSDDQPDDAARRRGGVQEGLADAVFTSLIALHDLRGRARQQRRRLDLHRQAQDARARGSGLRQPPVRPRSRICSACRATRSRSG